METDREELGEPLGEDDYYRGDEIDLTVPDGEEAIQDAINGGSGFEGDIHLNDGQKKIMESGTAEEKEQLRSATTHERHKWPKVGSNVVVPYTITNEFTQRERAFLARGFSDYERNTCIR